MTDRALSCYRVDCRGEFRPADGSELYRCEECGSELGREPVEQLAGDTGPVAQLATALLERAE